jgi:hypothetical protein
MMAPISVSHVRLSFQRLVKRVGPENVVPLERALAAPEISSPNDNTGAA